MVRPGAKPVIMQRVRLLVLNDELRESPRPAPLSLGELIEHWRLREDEAGGDRPGQPIPETSPGTACRYASTGTIAP